MQELKQEISWYILGPAKNIASQWIMKVFIWGMRTNIFFLQQHQERQEGKNSHSCWIFFDRVTKEELEEEIVDGWILRVSLDCSEQNLKCTSVEDDTSGIV